MQRIHSIGFPISTKENEKRRAILPEGLDGIVDLGEIVIEDSYGDVLGLTNDDYLSHGAHIADRRSVLGCDLIVDPKVGDADYLLDLNAGTTVFGWVHATQNVDITDSLIARKTTAYAWEKMFDSGRHVFWRNNELAGEAAVIHAFQCLGVLPYGKRVAVVGRGNTARGAMRALSMLGAEVQCYSRQSESLLRKELGAYDVVVNCVLWDLSRMDHIISRADLRTMRRGSMIVDVSCDRGGGIETSRPTSIENPIYEVEGVVHYAVDHTPALFYKTFTENNSRIVERYLKEFLLGSYSEVLKTCLIINKGEIVDDEINRFQGR